METLDKHAREAAVLSSLTEAQISRRNLMIGALASGALFTALGMRRLDALAQDTPAAGGDDWAPYDGPLAADQAITIPINPVKNFDPGVSYGEDELYVLFNLYDGLVRVDQRTGEVVPAVAESWEINEDASEYTFPLRKDVTWSDGTPIDAHDFVYSISRVLDPEVASQYTPAVTSYIKNGEAIENGEMDISKLGVKATDDYTLVITLVGPTVFFPLVAATWTYFPVPKHVIDEKGVAWVEAGNIVTNGPYKLTAWDHDQQFVIERNESYYGEKPTITKATFRIYADAATRLSETQHQVTARREELVRLLGLNESQAQALKLPERLPDLPKQALDPQAVGALATRARLDLRLAQTALDAAAKAQGLNMVTSFTDIELTGRRNTTFDNAEGTRSTARGWEIDVRLPLFDWGGMQRDAMNARTLAAANQLEATARAAGSSLRESYSAYRTAYDVARHYRDEVVPVRKVIAEENQLRYNGMLISAFELLADARDQVGAVTAALDAQQQFWLADAALQASVIGRPTNTTLSVTTSAPSDAGAGH